jgi:uncharacterized membrane protein
MGFVNDNCVNLFVAAELPVERDGDLSFFEDVHALVSLVESVSLFLNTLFTSLSIDRVRSKTLIEFLTPTDEDMLTMDIELANSGGFGGHWEVDDGTAP